MAVPPETRAGVHFVVSKIVDAEAQQEAVTLREDAKAMLCELVTSAAVIFAADAHEFAKHAGRKMITAADIRLLARHDAQVRAAMEAAVKQAGMEVSAAAGAVAGGTASAPAAAGTKRRA